MLERTSRMLRAVAVAFAAAVVVGGIGCEGACNTAANVLLPPKEEEKLGDKVEKEFLANPDVQLYEGQTVEGYVKTLGQEAVQAAGDDSPDPIEYEFKVIDNPDAVNAFAMPGGQIFFYTGLLKLADNQSEIMAVMAHEVAHVTKRHIAEKLVVRYGLQTLLAAAVGEDPSTVEKIAAIFVQGAVSLNFTRKQEKEADKVGFKYMVDAGYNPNGFVTFFQKLKKRKGVQLPKWLRSHPLPQDRIKAAKKRMEGQSFDDKTVGKQAHSDIVRALERGGGGGDAGGGDTGGDDTGGMEDLGVGSDTTTPDGGM